METDGGENKAAGTIPEKIPALAGAADLGTGNTRHSAELPRCAVPTCARIL